MALLELLLFSLFVGAIQGKLHMTLTPAAVNPGLDTDLTLNCSLTFDSTEVEKVTMIRIEKVVGNENLSLAFISLGEGGRLNTDFPGKETSVDGVISSDNPLESFLQLRVSPPDETDAGQYRCVVSTSGRASPVHPLEVSATVSLAGLGPEKENHNMSKADQLLIQELQKLRNQVDNLTNQVHSSGMTTPTEHTATPLITSKKTSSAIAFRARPSSLRPFLVDKLVFDTVHINVGNAYGPVNGTFTAPENGVYVFAASVSSTEAKTITELKVNGNSRAQIVTHGDNQSSVSLVLDLHAGDTVWLAGMFVSSNATAVFADKDTLFSGYLLHVL